VTRLASVIAANRFGLGARPGDLARIDAGPERWLIDQLAGPSRPPPDIAALPASSAVLVEVQELRRERRDEADDTGNVKNYGRRVREHYMAQAGARYRYATRCEQPFHERLVHFWSNHFAVSADKQPLPAIAGLYEKEAIRPYVTGKFADLLLAAIRHPAMILYLDNQRSVGPGSPAGRRAGRRERAVGLNENLAREILELHTLGVDGSYTQADVTTFAAVITGWSMGGGAPNGRFAEGEPGRFEFREAIHEPGSKTVLGRRYRQEGVAQGEAVLRDLAVHPSTARHLATKIARHFVADEPPERLVAGLTETFVDTGGDLAAVYETLVRAPEPWAVTFGKYKSPQDFVISAFRAFDHVPAEPRVVVSALDVMGQAPFRPGSPQGWPDSAEQWGGADALYKRIEWCNTVARVAGGRTNPLELADAALGPALTAPTRRAVARAESVAQGTTLLLASPEFQRR
jgi:uncharacterized protein (DUF1800 family)